ncbi:N-acetylneuraminate synthase family protein [Vogesella amnigena]|uniref:N-acetylneuraminate synthase family protein n=1 Tax=Vogesella amnigena TaxID=1507449 RepID=A0ABV7TU62_9NEIS
MSLDTRVGYSDHTAGSEVPLAAVAMGVEEIERHIMLNKSMEGPGHRVSLDPIELRGISETSGSGMI